jgi:hypothetical protein
MSDFCKTLDLILVVKPSKILNLEWSLDEKSKIITAIYG